MSLTVNSTSGYTGVQQTQQQKTTTPINFFDLPEEVTKFSSARNIDVDKNGFVNGDFEFKLLKKVINLIEQTKGIKINFKLPYQISNIDNYSNKYNGVELNASDAFDKQNNLKQSSIVFTKDGIKYTVVIDFVKQPIGNGEFTINPKKRFFAENIELKGENAKFIKEIGQKHLDAIDEFISTKIHGEEFFAG